MQETLKKSVPHSTLQTHGVFSLPTDPAPGGDPWLSPVSLSTPRATAEVAPAVCPRPVPRVCPPQVPVTQRCQLRGEVPGYSVSPESLLFQTAARWSVAYQTW